MSLLRVEGLSCQLPAPGGWVWALRGVDLVYPGELLAVIGESGSGKSILLDASIQAGIAALIRRLQERWQLGVLWITRDRALATRVADRILVLEGGRIAPAGGG